MKIFMLAVVFLMTEFAVGQTTPIHPVVHEWGTFTTLCGMDGHQASGLYGEEEPLPDFVKNITPRVNTTVTIKGYSDTFWRSATNYGQSRVKMETPVLYFYSKKPINNFNVSVDFKGGTISQYFPDRTSGESFVQEIKADNYGDISTTFNLENRTGNISWDLDILSPETPYSSLSHPDEQVPNIWLSPRKTQSNLVKSNGSIEKYLFYRGVGSFYSPVVLSFCDNGYLSVRNQFKENIDFYLLFEYISPEKIRVWETGSLLSGDQIFIRPSTLDLNQTQWNNYLSEFTDALVKQGLYEDEARAMLETWDHSYFHTPGIKFFYTVPRYFTDEILPVRFSIPVADLQRVMVGRAEIIDKNKHSELLKIPNPDDLSLFEGKNPQHYKYAYQYLLKNDPGLKYPWNTRQHCTFSQPIHEFIVKPNPATNNIDVLVSPGGNNEFTVDIFSSTGIKLKSSEIYYINNNAIKEAVIEITDIPEGLLIVKVNRGSEIFVQKILKQ